MMHGGGGRFGDMLNKETIKPRNLGQTLARLGGYFSRFWYMLFVALAFVVIATSSTPGTPAIRATMSTMSGRSAGAPQAPQKYRAQRAEVL